MIKKTDSICEWPTGRLLKTGLMKTIFIEKERIEIVRELRKALKLLSMLQKNNCNSFYFFAIFPYFLSLYKDLYRYFLTERSKQHIKFNRLISFMEIIVSLTEYSEEWAKEEYRYYLPEDQPVDMDDIADAIGKAYDYIVYSETKLKIKNDHLYVTCSSFKKESNLPLRLGKDFPQELRKKYSFIPKAKTQRLGKDFPQKLRKKYSSDPKPITQKDKGPKEFQVSDLLSLKLEFGRWDEEGYEIDYGKETYKVRIYIKNKPFRFCTYLLIVNPQEDDRLKEIESIDDAKKILNKDLERKVTPADLNISPEEEFWAHCSNIQAWYEHDYDTRLLDSKLAFPLLRKLMKLGDPKARKAYSKEVMERYAKGTRDIRSMLLHWDLFKYVPFEEQISIIEDPDDYDVIVMLKDVLGEDFKLGDFQVENGKVTTLKIKDYTHLESLPPEIGMLKNLQRFDISLPNLTTLPDSIGALKSLEELYITAPNLFSIPRSIGNLKILKRLHIESSQIVSLPEELGKLQNLKSLVIDKTDQFEKLPESLGKLRNLERLWIYNSSVEKLPESLGNLKLLKDLEINDSKLKKLPESFGNLESLQTLKIENSKLKELPESFGNLGSERLSISIHDGMFESLPESIGNIKAHAFLITKQKLTRLPDSFGHMKVKTINLAGNKIEKLPESFGSNTVLKSFYINGNRLQNLPESFKNLKNLESFDLAANNLRNFPNVILELKNLKQLDIGWNEITSIPVEITNLKYLEDLYLEKLPKLHLPDYLRYKRDKVKPILHYD
ncbi:MAG: hypothetical protein P8Y70_01225 [Candidatus Lokiarchaeota archaeon]